MILGKGDKERIVYFDARTKIHLMMVAEYQLQLPDKEILQKKLQELINIPLIEE